MFRRRWRGWVVVEEMGGGGDEKIEEGVFRRRRWRGMGSRGGDGRRR